MYSAASQVSQITYTSHRSNTTYSILAIYGAYAFGSSLVPEAKTYRLLADALNDAAVILDTLSPLLSSHSVPGLRVGALCLSASSRALCGIAAGGSKAAITLHFATPVDGIGDVGDLNAKDASKETVLALLGMLVCEHLRTAFLCLMSLSSSLVPSSFRDLSLPGPFTQFSSFSWLCTWGSTTSVSAGSSFAL